MNNLNYNNWGVGLCHATGKLIQEGFYFQQDDLYFSTQEYLFKYLRDAYNQHDLSDEELQREWYAIDDEDEEIYMYDSGFYYSEWAEEEDNINYIEVNGQIIKL